MPSKVLVINDWSGGLVTDKSARAIEDNELAECIQFDPSTKGVLKASKIFKYDGTKYGDQSEHLNELDFATHANWDVTGRAFDTGYGGGQINWTFDSGTLAGTLTQVAGKRAIAGTGGVTYSFKYTIVVNFTPNYFTLTLSNFSAESVNLPFTAGTHTVIFTSHDLAETADFTITGADDVGGTTDQGNFTIDDVSLTFGTEHEPGYGLFTFSNDFEMDGTTAFNGEFIAKTSKIIDSGTGDVDILEVPTEGTNSSDWKYAQITSMNSAQKTVFYAAEGDLFVGGSTAGGTMATPKSLVYHRQLQIPSAGSGIQVEEWIQSTQDKPAPSDGGGIIANAEMIIYETDGSGIDYNGADDGDLPLGQDDIHWIIRPSSNVAAGSGADGLWTNDHDGVDYYEYAASWLYKNQVESDLTEIQTGATGEGGGPKEGMYGATSFEDDAIQVRAYMNNGTPVTSTSAARYGARLYTRLHSDGGDWYLLAEVNYEKGIKGDGETEWNPWYEGELGNGTTNDEHDKWSHTDTGDVCTTGDIGAPPVLLTYKLLNGHSTGDIPTNSRVAKFMTAVIANSRAYIGNVSINGRFYGDRILKSPIFQYDVFTEDAYLEVAINDGDHITALAGYSDRLLEFKRNTLYIINISGELEFLEDEHAGAGVIAQYAVTDTPFGVVWVNTNGCYLYDGKEVTQLQAGKISSSDWQANVTLQAIIGYDPKEKQVVIAWSGETLTGGYVFSAETGNWHVVADLIDSTKNSTNMINTRGDNLVIGGGSIIADVAYLEDRGDSAASFSMKTKIFDFGNPESKKNLLEVAVVYKKGIPGRDKWHFG